MEESHSITGNALPAGLALDLAFTSRCISCSEALKGGDPKSPSKGAAFTKMLNYWASGAEPSNAERVVLECLRVCKKCAHSAKEDGFYQNVVKNMFCGNKPLSTFTETCQPSAPASQYLT